MPRGNEEDADAYDAAALAAYTATLLPIQQQAIATAQLAGCRFERRSTERDIRGEVRRSREGQPYRPALWIGTTKYEAFLPDGASAGTFEDIYEGALVCLSILNTPEQKPDALAGAFQLMPENRSPDEN
jgi:hypothetical protein